MNIDARARRATAAVLAVRPDPAADAGFVGRGHELTELLALLSPHSSRSGSDAAPAEAAGVVVVSAVAGAPGVGKTALAQAAARAATARGWFPGGAVTVDLHGYDPDPAQVVWPAQLYGGLLRALGLPGEQVPPTESDQATVYHQLLDQLAQADRPVLLVLDNAADTQQVAQVLPRGVGGHRVLMTSRDTLGGLPEARLLDLHILERGAAVELLTRGLQRRHPGDARVAFDPAAAARLVELCGRLPLAVQIVAALLGDEPDRPLTELADELADEAHRLRGLDYGGRWAVRAAFDLSYRRLDPPVAALFGWLSAAPGPDVGLAVAAAVADQDQPSTRAGLRALCRAHLLDQQPTNGGLRWRMHDLIRLYATEHLTPRHQEAGFTRALTHYCHSTNLACRRFTALSVQAASVPAGFTTASEAMSWVLTERAGLVAAVVHAANTRPGDAARLAADLAPFLERARPLVDGVTVAAAAVHATSFSNQPATATAWDSIRRMVQQVREIFRETRSRHCEGIAWNNLGLALRGVRRFEEAITAHQKAREIFRKTGDREGEGTAWNNLGSALQEVRRFDEAITAHQHARQSYQETGDRHGEGMAWTNLGSALRQVRRFDEAITAHQLAREIFREAGDRHSEGSAWGNLGLALVEVRRFEEAITALHQAREIFQETADRHREATAWHNLGLALRQMRRFDEAITAHEQAIAVCAELADHYGHAHALENLGDVHAAFEHPAPARRAWVEAVELFTAVGAEDDAERVRRRLAALDDR